MKDEIIDWCFKMAIRHGKDLKNIKCFYWKNENIIIACNEIGVLIKPYLPNSSLAGLQLTKKDINKLVQGNLLIELHPIDVKELKILLNDVISQVKNLDYQVELEKQLDAINNIEGCMKLGSSLAKIELFEMINFDFRRGAVIIKWLN